MQNKITIRYHFTKIKNLTIPSVNKEVEQLEPPYFAVGGYHHATTLENLVPFLTKLNIPLSTARDLLLDPLLPFTLGK